MLDVTLPFELPVRTATGPVKITVRYPSDEEWVRLRKGRPLVMKQLGRGRQEQEIRDTGPGDAELYEAIKLNGAPPLTNAEATKIIDAVGHCEVMGVELGTAEADVQLEIITGIVTHHLKIPTMEQIRGMQRATRVIHLPYGRQEIRPSLEAAAALWDKCGGRAEGYSNAVPNIHKDTAVRAVVNAIEQETGPGGDEQNF